jgi:hypothetical protein
MKIKKNTKNRIHTYHSRLISEGVAEASQILRDQNDLANTADRKNRIQYK